MPIGRRDQILSGMRVQHMDNPSSMGHRLATARRERGTQAGGSISGLAATAASLDMQPTAKRVTDIGASLEADTFSLMISGQFKNGKSTLLNSLLGRPERVIPELGTARGPMPTDP